MELPEQNYDVWSVLLERIVHLCRIWWNLSSLMILDICISIVERPRINAVVDVPWEAMAWNAGFGCHVAIQ